MKWSATAKVLLKRCKPCKQAGANPKDLTETWSCESRMPCFQASESVGLDVELGRITAEDLHGNGQADILANAGTAAHGQLEPEESWLQWASFANKVFHFWRLVGPQLRERPETEPRVRLPKQPADEELEVPIRGMVYPEAPFRLGPHLRVVRREDFLQCLNCTRITGKVRGEYNFAYMSRQACR
eukprot:3723867-Amphidinium_carterae.1